MQQVIKDLSGFSLIQYSRITRQLFFVDKPLGANCEVYFASSNAELKKLFVPYLE